jgi:hypothetical protein
MPCLNVASRLSGDELIARRFRPRGRGLRGRKTDRGGTGPGRAKNYQPAPEPAANGPLNDVPGFVTRANQISVAVEGMGGSELYPQAPISLSALNAVTGPCLL